MGTQHKAMTISGWIVTALIGLMIMSGIMKLSGSAEVEKQLVDKFGYPAEVIVPLGIVEICCVILYLVPQTAVLGAVLLTGYLGGAIATHVRVSDNFAGPAIGGVLVWLGLFLRDPRIRALLPFRRAPPSSPTP